MPTNKISNLESHVAENHFAEAESLDEALHFVPELQPDLQVVLHEGENQQQLEEPKEQGYNCPLVQEVLNHPTSLVA